MTCGGSGNEVDWRHVLKTVASKFSMVLAVLVLVGGGGCSSVGPAPGKRPVFSGAASTRTPAAKVRMNQPKHRPTTLQKLNPVFWFGNLDDPAPPDWYGRNDPWRGGKWYCRNALHNFTF